MDKNLFIGIGVNLLTAILQSYVINDYPIISSLSFVVIINTAIPFAIGGLFKKWSTKIIYRNWSLIWLIFTLIGNFGAIFENSI